jgi:hypothetical protein
LEFASVHSVVSRDQVARLLGNTTDAAAKQLSTLSADGLLSRERCAVAEASRFRITPAGADVIGSRLATPGFDPRVRHALGVGWLWLMATVGSFGSVDRVLTERQMRWVDCREGSEAPAAPLEEFGGGPGAHYPNLMLLTKQGRIAVELVLDAPAPRVLEPVLHAYAADVRLSAVLFLVSDPWVGRLVQSVAAWLELSPLVHVQPAMVPLS